MNNKTVTKMEFTVHYTSQITALIFAILIFTDISIKFFQYWPGFLNDQKKEIL